MLTDIQLKRLKPQEKIYKVTDRDGLYVAVSPTGTHSFRYDYRINVLRKAASQIVAALKDDIVATGTDNLIRQHIHPAVPAGFLHAGDPASGE